MKHRASSATRTIVVARVRRRASSSGPGGTSRRGPGCRCEGYGSQEFGIVAASGTLESIGPTMVKDELTIGMAFEVTGRAGQQIAMQAFDQNMCRSPAGFRRGRTAVFKACQESMMQERVISPGAGIPCLGCHVVNAGNASCLQARDVWWRIRVGCHHCPILRAEPGAARVPSSTEVITNKQVPGHSG